MLASAASRCEETVGAGLAGEIDALSAVDPDALDDGELGEAVVELQRQRARLAAVSHRLTAALDARRVWADDGSRSAGAWLAHRCRLPLGQARAEVRLGRRLRSMPATTESFAAGHISERHATLLGSLNAGRTATHFADHEAMLVAQARTLSWSDFCRAVEYWRQLGDPDGPEDDAAGDEARRRVHLSQGLRGIGILDGHLTVLGRATLAAALGRIEQELFEADLAAARAQHGEAATTAHLARTPAQRRHDALVEMAKRAATAPVGGKRPRPLVSVFVGYETLAGRICELADGTVVTPGTVASLLHEALIERVVFDGPSRVIDIGHTRTFQGAARRALELRDRHCTHPGCDVPAERCQGDHIIPWSHDGPTTQDNGQLRCGYHNRWRWQHPDPDADPDPPPDPDARRAFLERRRAEIRAELLAEQQREQAG